jgi:hypothetical protein
MLLFSNQIVGPTFSEYFDPEKEKTVLFEEIQRRDISIKANAASRLLCYSGVGLMQFDDCLLALVRHTVPNLCTLVASTRPAS